jgi:hypothetical protein
MMKSRILEMSRACSMHGGKRNAYRILVEKPRKDHKEDLDVGGSATKNGS